MPHSVVAPAPVSAVPGQSDPLNGNYDAFGRLRVSEPFALFECTFPFDLAPILTTSITANGGTVAHNANKQAAVLTATTTANSSAIFQTRAYHKYHPGKSSLLSFTGNIQGGVAGITKRWGLFDENNGMFFQLTGTAFSVVVRSKVSGSVVDTVVTQSNFSVDPLDGTGPSGLTIDLTKQQLFILDFQWQGSGHVRFGVNIGGSNIYVHEFRHANILTTIYNQFGFYPIRGEITNTAAATSTMELCCITYASEGGWQPFGTLRTASNGGTLRNVGSIGSSLPVISLRKKAAYAFTPVQFIDTGIYSGTSDGVLLEIVLNGTLTGASWADITGLCQQDVSATAISGGTTIYTSYLRGSTNGDSTAFSSIFLHAANAILGTDGIGGSDTITLKATAITAGPSVAGFLNFRELV